MYRAQALRTFFALLVFFGSLGSTGIGQDRITGKSFATRSEVIAAKGMAATSQPLATQIALDILKKGGSAVDAAIGANAALGLMEPTGNGIGGDLFAIVWSEEEKKLYGLNASGRSPKSLTLEKLREELGDRSTIPSHGPLPISVPGCVDGWFELHGKIRKIENAGGARTCNRVCPRGFSSFRIDCLLLESKPRVGTLSWIQGDFPAGRQGA